jgi:hypothetical protein
MYGMRHGPPVFEEGTSGIRGRTVLLFAIASLASALEVRGEASGLLSLVGWPAYPRASLLR